MKQAYPEAKFLYVTGAKVLRVFLLAMLFTVTSTVLTNFYSPPPLEKKWFETGL
jgi:hypothetical protein